MRQLLDEVLDGVLPQSKEVGPRDRVGVHAVADVVRRAHDHGPRTGRGTCDDGLVRRVGCGDLELGAVTAIEDLAVVDDLSIQVDRGQIAPMNGQERTRDPCQTGGTRSLISIARRLWTRLPREKT